MHLLEFSHSELVIGDCYFMVCSAHDILVQCR